MTNMISVIVPIYNGEQYLARCLDSLKRQTVQNIEFLLIDDGSTDGSAEICRQYVANDSRFKYNFKNNGGVSSARNLGLDLATGDYIGFCDCDDWVDDDYYECLYHMISESGADIAALCIQNEDGKTIAHDINYVNRMVFPATDIIMATADGYPLQSVWTKIFSKDILHGLRFDSTISIGEDLLFCMAASLCAKKIVFDTRKKYHYFWRETSATKQYYKESKWTERDAYLKILQLVGDQNPDIRHWTINMLLHCDIRVSCIAQRAKKYSDSIYQMVKYDFSFFLAKQSEFHPSFSVKCVALVAQAPKVLTKIGLNIICLMIRLKCALKKQRIDGLS